MRPDGEAGVHRGTAPVASAAKCLDRTREIDLANGSETPVAVTVWFDYI